MNYIVSACLLMICSGSIHAQTISLEEVLAGIEANSRQLQANKQETLVQKLEAKTVNNLPDPTVSYAYMWGKHNSNETISEMEVSQSFDFPTLYATRGKLNRLRMGTFDSRSETFRRDLLLQAKELCMDIIMLRQQKRILDERLNNARKISAMYAKRLQAGDANILETNKINLELLNVKTEASLNTLALHNKLQELEAMNGNNPIDFEDVDYPATVLANDFETLRNEVLATDMSLHTLDREAATSQAELNLHKSQWLPKLELGYRRNTESGLPFNGLVVGFSIPLFENRNKVTASRAQSVNVNYQKENRTLEIESELARQYREAQTLRSSMEEYEKTFAAQSDLELLKQALMGGEISMIAYLMEIAVVYQSKMNYIQLQNQYQKVMARMYKNRL